MRMTDQNVLLNALKDNVGTIDYIRLFEYGETPIGDQVSITWDGDAKAGELTMTTNIDISITTAGTIWEVGLLSSNVGYTRPYIVTSDIVEGGSQPVEQYDYFRVEGITLTIND